MVAKEIPFEKCVTNAKDKAQWFKDYNGGLLPILENPKGQMINESNVIYEFACDHAPKGQGLPLYPHELDPALILETAEHRLKI